MLHSVGVVAVRLYGYYAHEGVYGDAVGTVGAPSFEYSQGLFLRTGVYEVPGVELVYLVAVGVVETQGVEHALYYVDMFPV